jgi:mannose-6-phosphate isomerase-like protein (cupin superfamily)
MTAAHARGEVGAVLDAVPAGQAVTLAAGDAAYIPAYVAGQIRNEGQERAERLAILVLPPQALTGAATPAP